MVIVTGDGWTDYHEESCGTDPLKLAGLSRQIPIHRGFVTHLDADDDNDGWWDHIEQFYVTQIRLSGTSVPE